MKVKTTKLINLIAHIPENSDNDKPMSQKKTALQITP